MSSVSMVLCILFIAILPGLGIALYVLRGSGKFNLLDGLILSLIISPILLVPLSFIVSVFGLSLSLGSLILNLVIIDIISLYIVSRIKPDFNPLNLVRKLTPLEMFAYFGMVIILVAKIASVIKLQTPLLHDPIAHSEWLKLLTKTGMITTQSWYPQGLEYYLQYFTKLGDIEPAKAMLLGTNLFLCLIPISFYYSARLIKNGQNGLFAISALIIASVLAMPNNLFYTAGKNSMIMAFALVPIGLLYIYMAERSNYDNTIIALLLFAIFIIHYPTGVFIYLLWGINFVWMNIVAIKNIKDTLRRNLTFIVPTFVLLLMSLIKVYPLYIAFPASDDKSVAGIIATMQATGIKQFLLNDFLTYQIGLFGFIATITFIGAVFLYLLSHKKPAGDMVTRFLMSFALLYLCFALLLKLPEKTLGIFFNIEIRFITFFALVFVLSWFVDYISDFCLENYKIRTDIFIYIVLAIILVVGNLAIFNKFRDAGNKYSTVSAADVSAFDYIRSHVSTNDKVLVQMARGNGVVMPTDAGAWISTYTDVPIEVDFSNFSKPISEKIFDQYQTIGSNDKAIYSLYCDYGIRYVYFGTKPVFSPGTDKKTLERTGQVTIAYNNQASLYKVIPQYCSN